MTTIYNYLQLFTIISETLDLRNSWQKDNIEEKKKLSLLAEEIKTTWESEIRAQENTILRITELEKLREKEKLEAHACVLQLSVENRRLQDLLAGSRQLHNRVNLKYLMFLLRNNLKDLKPRFHDNKCFFDNRFVTLYVFLKSNLSRTMHCTLLNEYFLTQEITRLFQP